MLLLVLLLQLVTASAIEPPDPGEPLTVSLVGPGFLEPTLPLPEDVRVALSTREYGTAIHGLRAIEPSTLHGSQVGDRAFLLAWALLRDGRDEEAVPLLEAVRSAQHVPADYLHLTIGELLLASGRYIDAALELQKISETSPNHARGILVAAEAYHEAGSTQKTVELWESLAQRPHPAVGSEIALLSLAKKKGLKSERAYPYLRTLWTHYPTSAEAQESASALAALEAKGSAFRPTLNDMARHGDALMRAGHHNATTRYLSSRMSRFGAPSPASCIARYAYGRSSFKTNQITRAATVLTRAGRECVEIDEDRGAKSLYIAGKSLERKKEWAEAAAVYQLIPELYPEHSMADDGFALAGIAWQEVGRPEHAQTLWEKQVTLYPSGDLAAEGFWRLAWTAYLAGNTAQAIEWAEMMIAEVPVETSPMHWMGAHYWSARWRLYPSVDDPTVLNRDEDEVAVGVSLLVDLCERYPSRFYSLLAAARLYELDPERVSEISRTDVAGHPGVWTVRDEFLSENAVQDGLQLARLGLVSEAMVELNSLPQSALLPSELALITEVDRELDWTRAHDRLHKYLLHHPAAGLGPDRDRILRDAYPDSYWDLIVEVSDDYDYDPRIFHALVREESSFNPQIVSWAGARGLSQLMPPTARQVAGWLGIPISDSKMFDPETNLAIGTRYLHYLHGLFKDNHMLSVAGYNAGEGNVQKWVRRYGNIPTDEFIESIPFRETRRYVKRVLGTYQVYTMVYGEGPLYADWSRLNHQAIPD